MASFLEPDERQEWSHRCRQIAEYTQLLYQALADADLPSEVVRQGTLHYLEQVIQAGFSELAIDKMQELDFAALKQLEKLGLADKDPGDRR